MADELIRETISITRTSITENDKDIADAYARLIKRALGEATRILRFGTMEQRMRIITSAMGAAKGLASVDAKVEVERHRVAFESMIDEMVDVVEIEPVVVAHGRVYDVDPRAIAKESYDQGDGPEPPPV